MPNLKSALLRILKSSYKPDSVFVMLFIWAKDYSFALAALVLLRTALLPNKFLAVSILYHYKPHQICIWAFALLLGRLCSQLGARARWRLATIVLLASITTNKCSPDFPIIMYCNNYQHPRRRISYNTFCIKYK